MDLSGIPPHAGSVAATPTFTFAVTVNRSILESQDRTQILFLYPPDFLWTACRQEDNHFVPRERYNSPANAF